MPEFLRVRGAILAQAGEATAAEQAFQASLDMADAQGALSWRLRTVSSQARLRLKQGRLAEAREPLVETYGRFTEGFETLDLRTARALIAEIDARTDAHARRPEASRRFTAISRGFTALNSPGARRARDPLVAPNPREGSPMTSTAKTNEPTGVARDGFGSQKKPASGRSSLRSGRPFSATAHPRSTTADRT